MPSNRIESPLKGLRMSLLAMYEDAKSETHAVVAGLLREGLIRVVLQGHLCQARHRGPQGKLLAMRPRRHFRASWI
jgi:hypothetical protein